MRHIYEIGLYILENKNNSSYQNLNASFKKYEIHRS